MSKDTMYPFKISVGYNEQMRCHEIFLQVGGCPSKEAAHEFAKTLSEFMGTGGKSWVKPVQ